MPVSPEKVYDDWEYRAEWPDQYGPGLFCPIYLGDRLKDRYIIFRKLGYGSQSTVWLARDEQTSTHVAVKVHSAEFSETLPEITAIDHPGARHVERLLDKFLHESPNGSHLCLVLEPLGRNLHRVLERAWDYSLNLPMVNLDKYDAHDWSWRLGRKVCYQLVLGLDYLHSQKIAHLDFHPGNIAFALGWDSSAHSENDLQEDVWFPKSPDNNPVPDQEVYKGSDPWQVRFDELSLDKSEMESNEPTQKSSEQVNPHMAIAKDGETDRDSDESDDESTDSDWDRGRQEHKLIEAEAKAKRKAIIDALPDGDISASPSTIEWAAANLKRTASVQNVKFIKRLDGKPLEPSEVKYTLISSPLHDRLIIDLIDKKSLPFRLVIMDLGFSRPFDKCPKRELIQNSNFRTPECVLEIPATWQADIWSLGLIIWWCITDRPLYQWYGSRFDPRRSVISYFLTMIEKIGPIPTELRSKWPEADDYTDDRGSPLMPHHDLDDDPLDEEDTSLGDLRFAAYRDRRKDMADEDVECFVGLMEMILKWEPEKRPSTAEILMHPFFEGMSEKERLVGDDNAG